MKLVKIINSKNGKINIYDSGVHKLIKPFYSYQSLKSNAEELIYNLIDSGFAIKGIRLCLNTDSSGIVFYLDINMKYLK